MLAEVIGVGAADFEAVRGPCDDVAAVAAGDAHGLVEFVFGHGGVKFLPARLLEHLDKKFSAAVTDGRFVGVELDHGVVDAAAAQGGEKMFDGVDLDAALTERGGALDVLDVIDMRGDGGLIRQIGALEDVAGIGRRRFDGERDFSPGVKGGTVDGGGFADRGLLEAGHKGRA